MFSEKWKKPNFSHLPLFKIISVETRNTKAFYKVAIFGRLNFYNLNVFNLWNESIPSTITITTFHLNYASPWPFQLLMYELFIICNVTEYLGAACWEPILSLLRISLGQERDSGSQMAHQNPRPRGWKNGRAPYTVCSRQLWPPRTIKRPHCLLAAQPVTAATHWHHLHFKPAGDRVLRDKPVIFAE